MSNTATISNLNLTLTIDSEGYASLSNYSNFVSISGTINIENNSGKTPTDIILALWPSSESGASAIITVNDLQIKDSTITVNISNVGTLTDLSSLLNIYASIQYKIAGISGNVVSNRVVVWTNDANQNSSGTGADD